MDVAHITDLMAEQGHRLGVHANFSVLLVTMALLMCRILPVIILTPMIGGETTPTEVKFGLGVIIALVLVPQVALERIPQSPVYVVGVLMKELFVGYTLAFIVGRVFDAANVGGQLMDNLSGTNMAQVLVPALQQTVSLYASLQVQLFVTLFLTLGGHHIVINALADSLITVPLDGFPTFSHGVWPFFHLVVRVFGDLFKVALAVSSPVLLAAFLTDLSLGMINRVAPQVQVFFISMQIKPAVAILIVFSAVHLILTRATGEFTNMFGWLHQAIRLLG